MKTFLFLVLFAGTVAAAQTEEQRCRSEVYAGVHSNEVVIVFNGQPAKKIFDAMPESSKLSPKENCYTDVEMKVKGGFVCFYTPDSIDPPCAYRCSLEISATTGKALEFDRNNMCERDP